MSQDIRYTRLIGTPLTDEQRKRIEDSLDFVDQEDEDCPVIDPDTTPELFAAMMEAVGKRNRKIHSQLKNLA